ncbi:MAG: hypothetical protein FWF69_10545 [Firmicutes bacterium]|nr:hypothetical protein [Bacillota bacterium]
MKKIIALAFALILVMSVSITASAAGENRGGRAAAAWNGSGISNGKIASVSSRHRKPTQRRGRRPRQAASDAAGRKKIRPVAKMHACQNAGRHRRHRAGLAIASP